MKITPGHLFGIAACIAALALLVLVMQQRDDSAVPTATATASPTMTAAMTPTPKATETPAGFLDGRPIYERQGGLVAEDKGWEIQIALLVLDERTEEKIEDAVVDVKIKTPDSEEVLMNQANGTILEIKAGSVVSWQARAEGYETQPEWNSAKFVLESTKVWLIRTRLAPLSPQT